MSPMRGRPWHKPWGKSSQSLRHTSWDPLRDGPLLSLCVQNGDVDGVRGFLDRGCPVDFVLPAPGAATGNGVVGPGGDGDGSGVGMGDSGGSSGGGDTILLAACRWGHAEVVALALRRRAKNDPHYRAAGDDEENSATSNDAGAGTVARMTALQIAVSCGHVSCVRTILDVASTSGYDSIIVNHSYDDGGGGGGGSGGSGSGGCRKEAPIHVACRCFGDDDVTIDSGGGSRSSGIEMLEVLLSHGADVRCVDGDGRTCIHVAAQHGRESCLRHLLGYASLDVDDMLDQHDLDGRTPLHLAVLSNHVGCVKALLETAADANALTIPEGWTSFQLAEARIFRKVLRILEEYGGSLLGDGEGRAMASVKDDASHLQREDAAPPLPPDRRNEEVPLPRPFSDDENVAPPPSTRSEVSATKRHRNGGGSNNVDMFDGLDLFTVSCGSTRKLTAKGAVGGSTKNLSHGETAINVSSAAAAVAGSNGGLRSARDSARMHHFGLGEQVHYHDYGMMGYHGGVSRAPYSHADSVHLAPPPPPPPSPLSYSPVPYFGYRSIHQHAAVGASFAQSMHGEFVDYDNNLFFALPPQPPAGGGGVGGSGTLANLSSPLWPRIEHCSASVKASAYCDNGTCEWRDSLQYATPVGCTDTSRRNVEIKQPQSGVAAPESTKEELRRGSDHNGDGSDCRNRLSGGDQKELALPGTGAFASMLAETVEKRKQKNRENTTSGGGTSKDDRHTHTASTNKANGSDFTKYVKMASVGVPLVAVENKMRQDGIDQETISRALSICRDGPNGNSPGHKGQSLTPLTPLTTNSVAKVAPSNLSPDEQLSRSRGFLVNKAKQEGIDRKQIKSFEARFSDELASSRPTKSGDPSLLSTEKQGMKPTSKVVHIPTEADISKDIQLSQYAKMASVGVPPLSVVHRMTKDGVDPNDIRKFEMAYDLLADVRPPAQPCKASPRKEQNVTKEDLEQHADLKRFLKMCSVGVPSEAVANKMQAEGVPKKKIDMFQQVYGIDNGTEAGIKRKRGESTGLQMPPLPPRPPPRRRTSVTMQKIHWKPVAEEKLQDSLWASASEGDDELDQAEIKQLESLFGATPSKQISTGPSKIAVARAQRKGACLIDLKRANNIAISLAQFRSFATFDELCRAVVTQDKANFDMEKLQNMTSLLPTQEELATIKRYEKGTDGLGRAELFFLSVSRFPRFKQKLDSFVFSLQFPEHLKELRGSMDILKSSCEEVTNSKKLAGMLKRLLAVGNLLNESTEKPKAVGITLDSLLKTANKKGSDGKTTVLDHVIATMMKQGDPDRIVSFWLDMPSVRDASKVDIRDCRAALRELQAGVRRAETTSRTEKNHVSDCRTGDSACFIDRCEAFLERARGSIADAESELVDLEEKVESICCFFAEDAKTCKVSTILTVLLEFSKLVDKSRETWCRKDRSEKRRATVAIPVKRPETMHKKTLVDSTREGNGHTENSDIRSSRAAVLLRNTAMRRRQSLASFRSPNRVGRGDAQMDDNPWKD